jgi:hypothetical protein
MTTDEVQRVLRDAGYTAVGFGLLAFQRAQVRRREIERSLRAATSVSEDLLRWAVGLPERDRDGDRLG